MLHVRHGLDAYEGCDWVGHGPAAAGHVAAGAPVGAAGPVGAGHVADAAQSNGDSSTCEPAARVVGDSACEAAARVDYFRREGIVIRAFKPLRVGDSSICEAAARVLGDDGDAGNGFGKGSCEAAARVVERRRAGGAGGCEHSSGLRVSRLCQV